MPVCRWCVCRCECSRLGVCVCVDVCECRCLCVCVCVDVCVYACVNRCVSVDVCVYVYECVWENTTIYSRIRI